MLFAEIAAEGWVLIIGAISVGVTNLLVKLRSMHLEYKREQARIARDEAAAEKAEAVKKTLETVTADTKVARAASQAAAEVAVNVATAHGQILDEVKQGVQKVELNTNGALEAERRKSAALQARLDALLEAQTPPVVAETLVPLAEKVDHLVEVIDQADKSGVFRAPPPVDPANPPRRRRDDPPGAP